MNFQPRAGIFCIIHKEIKKIVITPLLLISAKAFSLNSFSILVASFWGAADYLLAYNHAIKIACKIESHQLAFVRSFSELYGSAKNETLRLAFIKLNLFDDMSVARVTAFK
jgi:hypothetical protein